VLGREKKRDSERKRGCLRKKEVRKIGRVREKERERERKRG